jgi:hypothetical protein
MHLSHERGFRHHVLVMYSIRISHGQSTSCLWSYNLDASWTWISHLQVLTLICFSLLMQFACVTSSRSSVSLVLNSRWVSPLHLHQPIRTPRPYTKALDNYANGQQCTFLAAVLNASLWVMLGFTALILFISSLTTQRMFQTVVVSEIWKWQQILSPSTKLCLSYLMKQL